MKIAEALRNNQSLVALDLSYNHFGEEGGFQIAQGLVSVGEEGGFQIAQGLVIEGKY